MQRTLVMVKPDGVQRGLVGEVISRLERKGLKLVAVKFMNLGKDRAEKLYSIHKERKFYGSLIKFVTGGPVCALAVEGANAITLVRNLMGATFGTEAAPGTIRGDFGASRSFNLVHGSDSPESASRELPILFDEKEFVDYRIVGASWVFDEEDK
ncbi:MAG: nucleoside-diphosphate kinase [Candidatus Brocadiae bacterium]|nr:nucleoside-diphosphate kinase [Candidatus Brocadiia bacterium]